MFNHSSTNYYIQTVFDLSNNIVNNSHHVSINREIIDNFSRNLPDLNHKKIEEMDYLNIRVNIFQELIASSVNFCYWYGSYKNHMDSFNLYKALYESINYGLQNSVENFSIKSIEYIIEDFYRLLVEYRFSMLEERRKRLFYLKNKSGDIFDFCIRIASNITSFNNLFSELFYISPEFSDDLFLKRAILFVKLLNRNSGLFKDHIDKFPIPADYQIPKILRNFGILEYSKELNYKIENKIFIPKSSCEESEIRAYSIIASKIISDNSGLTMFDIDDYLFSLRNSIADNHHLTYTTDY